MNGQIEPVKVSEKVFEALEFAKSKIECQLANDCIDYAELSHAEREEKVFEEMVEQYTSDVGFRHFYESELAKCLHDLSLRQFVRALDFGYEIDRTPEEQVAAYFKMMGRSQEEITAEELNENDMTSSLSEAQAAILAVFGILGIEIKGVNK
ncbi:hypothetical protein [Lysinibacillus sp. Bpr_S20]|uniref:hypothetical protein n=1 Tax=Lysinibacillus sp. Bpr_S20 TaxID=2933964 RepID=UPI002012F04A|nr:hypothetical protein [Lysinibacillus sp. Bpr_S20]MCL1701593.1 hypothetical protein [Lysinibacillus sp. Bpr_S20]